MLDDQRNKNTSYSVYIMTAYTHTAHTAPVPLACVVTKYPPVVSEEPHTITGTFRYDALPKWMTDSMKMLDAAAVDNEADIPGFGRLCNGMYWFTAEQIN